MTSVEENTTPPEWLIQLEKKKGKPHRLAHEIGAGSPCLKCGDLCPGLDLHFWRKLCRNCKCKKEDHDVIDDDSYSHFNILFGNSITKDGVKPKKAVLELCLKNGKERPVPLDWTPPNIAPDLAKDYMECLPQNKVPISNSEGATYRRQQLEKQIPLHDFDPKLCHELSPSESKQLEDYASNVRNSVVGQGRVVRIPVVKGFTSSSTLLPTIKPCRTIDQIKRPERDIFLKESQMRIVERSGQNSSSHEPCSSSTNKDSYFELLKNKDGSYERMLNTQDFEKSSVVSHPSPNYSQELKASHKATPKEGMISVIHNPQSYLKFSEAVGNKNPQFISVKNRIYQDGTGNQDNFGKNISSDPQNYQNKFVLEGNDNNEILNMGNFNYVVDKDENYQAQGEESSKEIHRGFNEFEPNNKTQSAHYSVKKGMPVTYLEYSKDMENKNPSFSTSSLTGKLSSHSSDNEGSTRRNENMSSNLNYLQKENNNERSMKVQNEPPISGSKSYLRKRTEEQSPVSSIQSLRVSPYNENETELANAEYSLQGGFRSQEEPKNKEFNSDTYLNLQKLDDNKINKELESMSLKEEIKCSQCEKDISIGCIAVVVQKKGKTMAWHPECFICNSCQELLVDLLYFHHKGKVYCGRDYAQICGIPRCYACDELIFMKSYTQAEGQSFHLRHFSCLECDTPLADKEYLPMNGHPICLPCYDDNFAKHCLKCNGIISATEKTVRSNDLSWHANDQCFSCQYCNSSLLNSKFTLKNNQPFCTKNCVQEYSKLL